MELELVYFNFPFWRAEVPRLALHLGNVPFRDHRVSGDEFRAMKERGEIPLGQLPILKVDGKILTQSIAIARFCGSLAKMYPKDPWQAAQVDQIFEVVNELTYAISPSVRERDLERKNKMRHDIVTVALPKAFGFLEQQLKISNSEYFVGLDITIGDLVVWRVYGWFDSEVLDGVPRAALEPFVELKRHYEHISSEPRIKAWMSQSKSE